MKYVIGLGNPGRKYSKTRHNIGWLVLDEIIGKGKWCQSTKGKTYYFHTEISDNEVELLKPTTYMNNSGQTILRVKKNHPKSSIDDFIIIHDDKDLDFGQVQVAHGRSSAGHRGVESVIEALGSKDFTRIRVGVKNELLDKMETDKFVLNKFSREERKELKKKIIPRAIELVEDNI